LILVALVFVLFGALRHASRISQNVEGAAKSRVPMESVACPNQFQSRLKMGKNRVAA
jgi:hypothetical protein